MDLWNHPIWQVMFLFNPNARLLDHSYTMLLKSWDTWQSKTFFFRWDDTVVAIYILVITGYFCGIKNMLFLWGFLSTYNWYFGP